MQWADNGGGFQDPPTGTHVARCIKLVDLGTQKSEYQGKVNHKRQVIITWELPNELMGEDHDNKPFTVSEFFTASLGEKAKLRQMLVNWRGRDFTPEELSGFSPKKLLCKACMVTLTKNDKGKVKVTGVAAIPKGMNAPAQINPEVYFSLDEYDEKVYESLSAGIKAIIQRSPEYQSRKPKRESWEEMENDIPREPGEDDDNF